MKVDCPSCKLESSGCSSQLSSFSEVWNKKKFIVPYVVFGNQRYIMAGTARAELDQWCTNTALRFKSFGKMREPLKIESVRQINADTVEVRYYYRYSESQCNAIAIVETEYLLGNTLIKKLRQIVNK